MDITNVSELAEELRDELLACDAIEAFEIEAIKSFLKKFAIEVSNSEHLTCEDCGKTSEDVKETNCPYAEEINDSMVLIHVCKDCYHDRVMDI